MKSIKCNISYLNDSYLISMTLKKNHKYISRELFETTKLSELKKLSAKELLDLGQIEYPLYKSTEDETYSLISYERASELIARRIKQSNPENSFFYASGRSSNEASFALDLFARSLGCNHINTCSNYCHEASGIALSLSLIHISEPTRRRGSRMPSSA